MFRRSDRGLLLLCSEWQRSFCFGRWQDAHREGTRCRSTSLTVTAADGTSQTVVVTVRKSAGNNGWM
ncbi:hypothetical protein DW079_04105 [Segatella copri]|uniref:Uncharacterized protein n=1 Tax=Segatella copri TaxID=165179 RepID=A0A415F6T1_9BACT|nr:hypothetical protein DW079_04105 [Segatella copri]